MFIAMTHMWLSGWVEPKVVKAPYISNTYSFIPLPIVLIERDIVRGPPVN